MIGVSDSEESAKRHDRVSDLAGLLVDHQVVDGAQPIASIVEDVGALDFIGGDKGRCFRTASIGIAPWLLSEEQTQRRVGRFQAAAPTREVGARLEPVLKRD